MRLSAAAFLIALHVIALPAARAEPQALRKQAKVGYLTDLAGPGAYWGTQSLIGAQLAVEDLAANEQIDLALVVESHEMQTAKAISAAQKMLMIDGIDAMYAEFSPTVIAISPILRNQKKLLLYVAAATSVVDSNPYSFKSFLDYEESCGRVAKYYRKQNIARIGYMKINSEAGELCIHEVSTIYPDLFRQDYDPRTDVSSQVLTLRSKGVEAIVNAGLEPDVTNMLNVLQRLNWAVPLATNEDAMSDTVRKAHPEISGRAIVFGLHDPDDAFAARIRQRQGAKGFHSLPAIALGYLHTLQLGRAVAACPKGDFECQSKQLFSQPDAPALGFHGWGENRRSRLDIVLKVVQDGKLIPLQL